jgi:hypothetical protein
MHALSCCDSMNTWDAPMAVGGAGHRIHLPKRQECVVEPGTRSHRRTNRLEAPMLVRCSRCGSLMKRFLRAFNSSATTPRWSGWKAIRSSESPSCIALAVGIARRRPKGRLDLQYADISRSECTPMCPCFAGILCTKIGILGCGQL